MLQVPHPRHSSPFEPTTLPKNSHSLSTPVCTIAPLAPTYIDWAGDNCRKGCYEYFSLTFQVDLPANERHVLSTTRVVIEGSQRCLTDSVNESYFCKHLSSGLPGALSEERADA